MDINAVRISLPDRIVARGWRNRTIVAGVSLRQAGLKGGRRARTLREPGSVERHPHLAQERQTRFVQSTGKPGCRPHLGAGPVTPAMNFRVRGPNPGLRADQKMSRRITLGTIPNGKARRKRGPPVSRLRVGPAATPQDRRTRRSRFRRLCSSRCPDRGSRRRSVPGVCSRGR